MLDFTSALYLGFRHTSRSLRPWAQLTTGVPAALAETPAATSVARRLAALQGCERAVLAQSTLHLFWDLFGMLARDPVAVFLDVLAYPVAGWGAERAAAFGVPVQRFPHHDATALGKLLKQLPAHLRPIIVTDGVCTLRGVAAPLEEYSTMVDGRNGWLVVDDTQALGIYGHSPGRRAPYGLGGGGSLRRSRLHKQNIILISSLAKGFGVPLAVLSASQTLVQRFDGASETRMHCSPPSTAAIHAAESALEFNAQRGDLLRSNLADRVRHFRRRLAKAGLEVDGALFPVQTIRVSPENVTQPVYRQLRLRGVRPVLRRGENGRHERISFIITARHRLFDLDRAAMEVVKATKAPLTYRSLHA